MSISDRFICEQKGRSAPANLNYVKITPFTGTSCRASESCVFRLPSNRIGMYFDPRETYISYKVTTKTAGDLSMAGCGGFYDSVSLRCGGNLLTELNNYQAWRAYNMKQSVSDQFLLRDGRILMGTQLPTGGDTLTTAPRVFVDFLSNFSPLFQTDCYLPLFSADGLELTIKFGDANHNFNYGTAGDDTTHIGQTDGLVFSEITLYMAQVTVPPSVDSEIIRAHNGLFKHVVNSVKMLPTTVLLGQADLVFNLGISFSSTTKVDIVFCNSDATTMVTKNDKFEKGGLTSFELLLDGSPIAYSGGVNHHHDALSLAVARASLHGLSNYDLVQMGVSSTYNTQSFVASIDCESITGKDNLRSGINASASTVQAVLKWANGASKNYNVYCFVYHDSMISMDTGGSRLWEMTQ